MMVGDMITPNGIDHQSVKMTYVAPALRAYHMAKEVDGGLGIASDGGSPNPSNQGQGPGQGSGQGMMGNNSNMNNNNSNWSINSGRGGGMTGRGGRGGGMSRFDMNNRGGNNRRSGFGGGGGGSGGGFRTSGIAANLVNANTEEILADSSLPLYSLTGMTQPVPYLLTNPPTREEIEDEDREYLAELGEEGSLLRTYWGPRGAQGSSVAAIVNSVTSLDSTALLAPPPPTPLAKAQQGAGPGVDIGSVHSAAQRRLKRPRLQDFSGRTPESENGGNKKSAF